MEATRSSSVKSKSRLKSKRQYVTSYLFLTPFLLAFVVFTVIPVLAAIVLGFTDFNAVSTPSFVGVENFVRMFTSDEVFFIAVRNTLVLAVLTGPFSYIVCVLLAWLVNECNKTLRVLFTILFYAPSLTGSAVTIWTIIFSGDAYGLLNSTLIRLGLLDAPIQWLTDPTYNLGVVIVVQMWLSLGVGFLSFIAGYQTIDRSIYEAGAIDGIQNRFQEFWYLTLASIRPQLMFGAVMQIGGSFSIAAVPMALTGFPSTNYSTTTIVSHILDNGTLRMEMGYACALATLLFFLMVLTNNVVSMIIKSE